MARPEPRAPSAPRPAPAFGDARPPGSRPLVKVCGITRREDARLAVELGADALGFVFWPGSPRAVTREQARAIVEALPAPVPAVGVFVNQSWSEVAETAAAARLSVLQLHGDEDPSQYLTGGFQVVKSVPVRPGFSPAALDAVPDGITILLDAYDPVRRGGTGRAIDWAVAAAAARARAIILSGGLRPENVRGAVDLVRPYAVDVSSGVESSPGVKDQSKLRAFFAALAS